MKFIIFMNLQSHKIPTTTTFFKLIGPCEILSHGQKRNAFKTNYATFQQFLILSSVCGVMHKTHIHILTAPAQVSVVPHMKTFCLAQNLVCQSQLRLSEFLSFHQLLAHFLTLFGSKTFSMGDMLTFKAFESLF